MTIASRSSAIAPRSSPSRARRPAASAASPGATPRRHAGAAVDLEELLGDRERSLGIVALERPGAAVEHVGEELLVAGPLRELERSVGIGARGVDPTGHRFERGEPPKDPRHVGAALHVVEVGTGRVHQLERPGVVAGGHLDGDEHDVAGRAG